MTGRLLLKLWAFSPPLGKHESLGQSTHDFQSSWTADRHETKRHNTTDTTDETKRQFFFSFPQNPTDSSEIHDIEALPSKLAWFLGFLVSETADSPSHHIDSLVFDILLVRLRSTTIRVSRVERWQCGHAASLPHRSPVRSGVTHYVRTSDPHWFSLLCTEFRLPRNTTTCPNGFDTVGCHQ